MAYLKMKEKIAKLYSQLDNFNVNSNQQRKKYFYNIPVSNERIKHYDSILLQGKNNSFRTTNSNSKIKNDKKILFKSKSIFDFNNDENLIFNRKNHINQNFQKKYNELKSFTNDFNPNSFDIPSKEKNLKRNKSSYFVLGNIQNYKNDKRMSKKDVLTKEIMYELGNRIKENSNKNKLNGIRSYSNFFEPRGKRDQFKGVQGVNII
jgi:hypothetical protein